MATFHGIIIYEILEDGNILNGVYSNTNASNASHNQELSNEIAIKEAGESGGLGGKYQSRYIETQPDPKKVTHCQLEVTKHGLGYEFVWSDKKTGPFYRGIGMRVGNSHIAVSYTNA